MAFWAAQARARAAGFTRLGLTPDELRVWRTSRCMSQGTLGELLGVTWVTVQRWETGQRGIPAFLDLALLGLDAQLGA